MSPIIHVKFMKSSVTNIKIQQKKSLNCLLKRYELYIIILKLFFVRYSLTISMIISLNSRAGSEFGALLNASFKLFWSTPGYELYTFFQTNQKSPYFQDESPEFKITTKIYPNT